MRINSQTLSAYRQSLNGTAEACRDWVYASIMAFGEANPGADAAMYEAYAQVLIQQAYEVGGDMAAHFACDFYDQCMQQMGINAPVAEMEYAWSTKTNSPEQVAAAAVETLNNEGTKSFAQKIANIVKDYVTKCAQQTTINNAMRDRKLGVRYAVVPQGVETCGFCIVHASRGFVYRSKDIFLHTNCDCTIVPGTSDTQVDGYDEDYYFELYEQARDGIEPGRHVTNMKRLAKELDHMTGRQGHHADETAEAWPDEDEVDLIAGM